MFSEITVTRIARPGKIEIHQACSISPRPSATITPHDGVGGGMPDAKEAQRGLEHDHEADLQGGQDQDRREPGSAGCGGT